MILIMQIDADVPAGEYGRQLDCMQKRWSLCRVWEDSSCLSEKIPEAVIVLGGAMGAGDEADYPFLKRVKVAMTCWLQSGIPMLGICLGGQLLAEIAGGKVASNRWGEKGTLPVELTEAGCRDPLFTGMAKEFVTFQWHNDSFDIPPDAVMLASSAACSAQAFRVGAAAYGVQFHPEVNEEIVSVWSREADETVSEAGRLLTDFRGHVHDYRPAAELILENFIRICEK